MLEGSKGLYKGPIQISAGEGSDVEVSMRQADLVSKHMDQFKRWENWRQPLESIWAEVYKLMFSQSKLGNIPVRSKIVLPLVFQIIEAAVPKIVTVIFGQPQWFQAKSRSSASEELKPKLEAHEELLRYQLNKADYFPKFVDFFKGLFMYGTAYLHVYWTVKREWVTTKTPTRMDVTSNGHILEENALKWEVKREFKPVERRPEIEVLPIEDVYPDPDSRSEKNSEGLYVSSTMSLSELEEMSKGPFPIYGNIDKVKELVQEGSDAYHSQSFKQEKRSARSTAEPSRDNKTNGKGIHILTYWGREDLDGDGIKEEVQMVFAEKTVLIRAVRNPFDHGQRPIIRGVLFPIPHEWFGMGLIEPVIGLINELITIRRQNLDMNNLIVNRMWKVHAMADIDIDSLHTSPNGIIVTGDMDGIDVIHQDPIPVSPLQMSELIQSDIENATAPKSIQGAPQSGALGRTFKGAQLIVSQALEKFGMGAKLLEESVIRKVLWMFKKLNEQFLDSDEVIKHFYGSATSKTKLTPEDMLLDLDFELLGISETVTRETTINQLIAAYNLAAANPVLAGFSIEIFREIMRLQQTGMDLTKIPSLPPPVPGMASALTDPNVSSGTEQAILGQVGQNGAGAPPAIPGA